MKLVTHAVCSLAVGLLMPGALPLVIAGAVLPDVLDRALRLRHRSPLTHNILTAALIACMYPVVPAAAYIALGVTHHLLLDVMTVQGVYVGNRRIAVGHLVSSDPVANIVITLLHLAVLALFL